jgi:hypothetical protein
MDCAASGNWGELEEHPHPCHLHYIPFDLQDQAGLGNALLALTFTARCLQGSIMRYALTSNCHPYGNLHLVLESEV